MEVSNQTERYKPFSFPYSLISGLEGLFTSTGLLVISVWTHLNTRCLSALSSRTKEPLQASSISCPEQAQLWSQLRLLRAPSCKAGSSTKRRLHRFPGPLSCPPTVAVGEKFFPVSPASLALFLIFLYFFYG